MAHFKSYSVAPARWSNSTDIDPDPRTCTIFILEWGSNWGYSGFSHYQNNCDSSWAYVLQSAHVDCGRILFVSTCMVGKTPEYTFSNRAWSCVTYYSPLQGSHYLMLDTVNPAMGMMLCSSMPAFEKVYTPNWSSMPGDAITRDGTGVLASPVYNSERSYHTIQFF